jgi:long-chain fatty acid transport protein
MNITTFPRSRLAAAITAAVLGGTAGHAFGSAFALQEQNASGLGHAYAGGAAAAEDVSTIFYNPAGLVRLQSPQVVVAGNLICLSAKFNNNASQAAAFQPLGGNGGDAGDCSVVPNLYVGVPFTDKWSFGLGINVPFGLKTEYDSDWLGRFQAIKSELQTINVNPVLSWEPTKNLTVGGGVSWQHVKATLTSRVNYAAGFAQGVQQAVAGGIVPPAAAPALIGSAGGLQSDAHVDGSDNAWGWNVGVLWQANDQTRWGAAYRSRIKYTIEGNIDIGNPTALGALPPALAPVGAAIMQQVSANPSLQSGGVKLDLKMPDTANFSVFHQFNNKWDLMADLQWTGWSSIQELRIKRLNGAPDIVTPENFRDTWRASVGANYRYSDAWIFRGGLAYDQSPVRDAERTPRLPDNNRTWLAMGVQYKISPQWAVDVAYAHIWVKNPGIDQNAGSTAAYGLINGSYDSNVNIGGLQVTYTFK